MPITVAISPRIVEGLYLEALVLAEEVRAAFTLPGPIEVGSADEDLTRIALSCEGLRATSRIMHAIAWLLNHRARFAGEISEFQLHRFGRLAANLAPPDTDSMMLLDQSRRELVTTTYRFYARLLRLDRAWRDAQTPQPSAIARIRARLGQPAEARLRGV